MPDYQVLGFIENRLVEFYGESRNMDYIVKLRQIRQLLEDGTPEVPEVNTSERYKMALEAILCVSEPSTVFSRELSIAKGIAARALGAVG